MSDAALLQLAAAALAGLTSRPNHPPRSPEDIGAEAAALARSTLAALEDIATAPEAPKPKAKR
ncbi:MAG TPA: hypothetical protein VLT47_03290 [Anaeromyxobacteraceae bacterium]|nr:hypothetical protein [Anaeromyxobacteraceae bacterium]